MQHVEQREGAYYVKGTRVTLDSIVYAFREGCSPEAIREDFEGLSLSNVYGAIAFFLDHQVEVDAYLRERREQWEALERKGSPPEPDLQARLDRARRNVSQTV